MWKVRLIGLASIEILWSVLERFISKCFFIMYFKCTRLSVLEFDPFVFNLVLGSSRRGRLFAAFIATLEFGVSSATDNSCWFSSSMNWKPGLFLLRIMKRGFQLTIFFVYVIYFPFKFLIDKFPGVEGWLLGAMDKIVLRWAVQLFQVLPVMFLFEFWWRLWLLVCWWSWALLQSSRGWIVCRGTQDNKICCSVARYMRHGCKLCKGHTICLLLGGGVCKYGSAFDRP